jgi:hypothetical protein
MSPEREPANVMTARMSIEDMLKFAALFLTAAGLLFGGLWGLAGKIENSFAASVNQFRGDVAGIRTDVTALRGDVTAIREKQASLATSMDDISRRTARIEAIEDRKDKK